MALKIRLKKNVICVPLYMLVSFVGIQCRQSKASCQHFGVIQYISVTNVTLFLVACEFELFIGVVVAAAGGCDMD